MKERLEQIIQYATHGNTARFADSVGWSRQYLGNVLAGRRGIGITPVRKVLQTYPDISARWLLTGEGTMLLSTPETLLRLLTDVLLARDTARTARTMERLTARLRDENRTKTAPRDEPSRNVLTTNGMQET